MLGGSALRRTHTQSHSHPSPRLLLRPGTGRYDDDQHHKLTHTHTITSLNRRHTHSAAISRRDFNCPAQPSRE